MLQLVLTSLLGLAGASPSADQPAHHPLSTSVAPASGAHAHGGKKHKKDHGSGNLVEPGKAKSGDRTWCPVSGEVFEVDADSPSVEYGGRTYYFCCPGCDSKFLADPAKYRDTRPKDSPPS